MKTIQGMKAITSHSMARNMGVKISIANAFIKSLEAKGVVRAEGGYSGHQDLPADQTLGFLTIITSPG